MRECLEKPNRDRILWYNKKIKIMGKLFKTAFHIVFFYYYTTESNIYDLYSFWGWLFGLILYVGLFTNLFERLERYEVKIK